MRGILGVLVIAALAGCGPSEANEADTERGVPEDSSGVSAMSCTCGTQSCECAAACRRACGLNSADCFGICVDACIYNGVCP